MKRMRCWMLLGAWLPACGPATAGPGPVEPGAEAGTPAADAGTPAADAGTEAEGPVEASSAVPPGYARFGASETVWWRVEGTLGLDALQPTLAAALPELLDCLTPAAEAPEVEAEAEAGVGGDAAELPHGVPAGRPLPLHVIVDARGRVVEVGGPLAGEAELSFGGSITCLQDALRVLRFAESGGDTTLKLILSR